MVPSNLLESYDPVNMIILNPCLEGVIKCALVLDDFQDLVDL